MSVVVGVRGKIGKVIAGVVGLIILAVLGLFAASVFYGGKTIYNLLAENKQLKTAITNLTREEQIGYAKVVSQERVEGKLITRLRFVETARDNKLNRILEKEYAVEGDVVYFDALIVKFDSRMVMDGKERSLYLWRRVFGETMAPATGFLIEEPGKEPERYRDLLKTLRLKDRQMFWEAVWQLANDPERLREHGIRAVYGNAVYSRLRPGLIYVFKIDALGQVYPEVVPEM